MKIEPMSVEEIKRFIVEIKYRYFPPSYDIRENVYCLILTWIHAEARAREARHIIEEHGGIAAQNCRHVDWIAAVKRGVGWPEGE